MPPTPHELTNPSFLQKLALDLIKPRKSNYPEDTIYYYLQQNKFSIEDLTDLKNKYNNLLKSTLVTHRLTLLEKVQQDFSHNPKSKHQIPSQKCIIYLHGLGSNRMEGFSILPHLPKGYALFSFDLSGSGKSQGDFTSYGFKQKQDIQSVLTYLYKQKNYREFIIWGRSMGAVASLLFNNLIAEKQNQTISAEQTSKSNANNIPNLSTIYKCVKCIVADSPFCSFEQISKDIALNKMSIPTFFTQIALKFLQNTFDRILYDKNLKKNFTPFQIDFTKNSLKPMFPIIFVYSLNDQIVKCEHSQKIIKSMEKVRSKMVEKVIIPECGHNLKRPQNVIQVIFQKIQRHCLASKNINIHLDEDSNRNGLNKSLSKGNQEFFKKTQNVRRKSFWNFQEQIFNNQHSQQTQVTSQNNSCQNEETRIFFSKFIDSNKFADAKNVNDKATVRKNIFNREEPSSSQKFQTQTIKKRGISLSSTIQRMESNIKENNYIQEISGKINVGRRNQNDPSIKNRCLNTSMQIKCSNVRNNQDLERQSPRKGIQKCSVQLMHTNFQKSNKNRPSLGGNRDRISLGGSIEKKLKGKRQDLIGNFNHKPMRHFSGNGPVFPAQKDYNKGYLLSTISYSDKVINEECGSGKKFRQLINKVHKNSESRVINQNLESEPNIISEDAEYQRTSSRQSLKTIDVGLMNNEVNESLTSFINNKLEFQFDNYGMVDGLFSKLKTLEKGVSQPRCNNGKQSVILSELDLEKNETGQNCYKTSNTNMSGHIALRPSSRLYHEKRKKKLQAQNMLVSKQNQNLKITNQRYLVED